MSRINIKVSLPFFVAVGKDHTFGYFAQVWSNQDHEPGCLCRQCEFDQPAYEGDNLAGWRGVIEFVCKHTGEDITSQIVGI